MLCVEHSGLLTVARRAHVWGVSIHEMSSEDHPLSSPTLSTWFVSLHEALQTSAGKVDLIHMIGHACTIETGEPSVPAYHVPVRSCRWFGHAGRACRHLLSRYGVFCWEPDSRRSVRRVDQGMFECVWDGSRVIGVMS